MSCLQIDNSIELILGLTSYLTYGKNNIINAAFHMELLGEHMWGVKKCSTDDEHQDYGHKVCSSLQRSELNYSDLSITYILEVGR
jgi:hypothetical protein